MENGRALDLFPPEERTITRASDAGGRVVLAATSPRLGQRACPSLFRLLRFVSFPQRADHPHSVWSPELGRRWPHRETEAIFVSSTMRLDNFCLRLRVLARVPIGLEAAEHSFELSGRRYASRGPHTTAHNSPPATCWK